MLQLENSVPNCKFVTAQAVFFFNTQFGEVILVCLISLFQFCQEACSDHVSALDTHCHIYVCIQQGQPVILATLDSTIVEIKIKLLVTESCRSLDQESQPVSVATLLSYTEHTVTSTVTQSGLEMLVTVVYSRLYLAGLASTTTSKTIYKSAISRIKTRIRALTSSILARLDVPVSKLTFTQLDLLITESCGSLDQESQPLSVVRLLSYTEHTVTSTVTHIGLEMLMSLVYSCM